jgi:hypothetical protein
VISNSLRMFTRCHRKYAAYDLSKLAPLGSDDPLSMLLFDASVDLNPHQIVVADVHPLDLPPSFIADLLRAEADLRDKATLNRSIEANNTHSIAARERLERWA